MQYKEYYGYVVREDGRIFSPALMRWLLPSYSSNKQNVKTGYVGQTLQVDGKTKRMYIHRIVCELWHENPDNKAWVNHKDGVRDNNHYTNLEWSTPKENIRHSWEVLGRKPYDGDRHWNKGKKWTDKTKGLMSTAKLGIRHPKFKGYYCWKNVRTGEVVRYESSIQAAKDHKTSSTQIIRNCNNAKVINYWFEPI